MSGQFAENQRSMDDILSSIRQTIEDDIKGGRRWVETHLGPAIGSVHPEGAPAPSGKVIELTELLNEDGSVTSLGTEESAPAIDVHPTPQPVLTLVQDAPYEEAPVQQFSQTQEAAPATGYIHLQTPKPQGENETGGASSVFTQQEATPMNDTNAAQQAVEDIFAASAQESAPEAAPSAPAEPSIEDIMAQPVAASGPEAAPAFPPEPSIDDIFAAAPPQAEASAVDLLSQETLAASSDALAALSDNFASSASASLASQGTGIGGKTLEALMQEMLRPMLKDWLDAHLPSLVKWIVTEQIEKVVQQRFGNQKN